MSSTPAQPALAQPAPAPAPTGSKLGATDKLLAAILAALVLLVASVLVVAGTVYYVTRPVPAPTGPTVTVLASGSVISGTASYSLSDASGASTVVLTDSDPSGGRQNWTRQVAFGQSIELTVLPAEVHTDDESGQLGSASCLLSINNTAVSKSVVNVVNGVGSCKWTNNGK